MKVVVPEPLPDGATEAERLKRQVNVASYANECAFLADARLMERLRSGGVRTPDILRVEVEAGKCFATLQECMTEDYDLLAVHPSSRSPEVLRWLAAFHACFLGSVPAEHELCSVGGHLHLDRRPSGELDRLPSSVADFCQAFAGESPFFGRPEARQLGERLRAVAGDLAAHLRPGRHNEKHATLVHGDFKGANYFLKKEGEGVVGFDWQWTGPGLGATDLIYMFCAGVEDSVVDSYLTSLREYHQMLGDRRGEYSFDALLSDFKVATLDYARWAFCVRLPGDTPEKFRERAAKVDVNMGYFRRHTPRVQWLLQRVEEFLPQAESGELFFRGLGRGEAELAES